MLESPTWRASPKWAGKLGYSDEQLDGFNRKAIALMEELRDAYSDRIEPIVISGCIGPQADAYAPEEVLDADAAREYHSTQINTFADTAADMVTAITMTYVDEAVGITEAAKAAGIPVAISFTVETDGRLPSGQSLGEAIDELDDRTDEGAGYVMLNCAHPTHFDEVLEERRPMDGADHGPARQRLDPQSRRARRGARPRRGRPGGPRRALRGAGGQAAAPERARRLLRHRRAPPHRDRDVLAERGRLARREPSRAAVEAPGVSGGAP